MTTPNLPPAIAAQYDRLAAIKVPGRPSPCHHCDAPATAQWQRSATDAEREQHWDASEQHIRSIPDLYGGQNDSYVADRSQPVTKAVFGCDDHQVDDMTLLHAADCGGHGACACGGKA